MWVSGKVQTTSAIPQMLNDLDTLHAVGLTVDTSETAYSLIDTSYINNHLFYCETRGSMHYFVSSDRTNASTIINSPGCEKTMTAIAITKTAGGKNLFDAYPYEYRPPLLGADSVIVQVPSGYFVSRASLKNKIVFNSFEYNSDTIGIPLTDTTGTVVFALSDLPPMNCFTQADTPSALNQTMWYGDQLNTRIIDMKLMPLTCNTPPISAPDTTIKIRFDRENVPCMTTAGCDLEGAIPIKQQGYTPVSLFINPGLNRTDTATTVLAVKDTVCWDIAMNNFTGLSQADHVFIAILPDGVQNFLSGWHFYPTDSTVAGYLNDTIVPITIALGHDSIITGKLCAVVNVCDTVNTIPINIHYGWNCGAWPSLPYDSTAVCGYNLDSLAVNFATVSLASDSGKTYETPYVLCDTIPVRTCYSNSNQGYVYPYEVLLSNIQNGVTVVSGLMQSSLASFPLIGTPGDSLWAITDSGLSVLYPQNGGFTNVDGQFCLTLNIALDCAFAGNTILPDKELFATTFCGDTISAFVNYSVRPEFVMDTTTSSCDACFTLEKFAIDTVTYTGTPITYYLTACNLSADTNIVNITDLIPPGFTPTSSITFIDTLQSMECDTFVVTGTFLAGDTCPNTTNTALLIHAGDTISDSWCVPVISTTDLCIAQSDTVWTGVLFSTSLPKTFINDTIYIADSLIVNDTLEFFNSRLIIGGGGSITVVDSGYLYVAQTIIEACDTMWRGITANLNSKVMITEQSSVRDANVAVLAKNKSVITIVQSNLLNNARNVVIPTTSGVTTMDVLLTMYDDTIAMVSPTYKHSYPGQPAHAFRPLSGVEAHHWVGTIGNSSKQKNVFMNLIAGINAERSLIRSENNHFINMHKDTTGAFNTSLHATGVLVYSSASQTPSSITISQDNYFFNCYYGTYTNRCATDIQGITMDTVQTGVHIRNGINTYSIVNACTINAMNYGVDLLSNEGSNSIDILNNTINVIKNATGTGGIRMQETTHNNPFYKIINNNISITGVRDGIVASNVYKPIITGNIVNQIAPTAGSNNNRGIYITGCDSAVVSCNTLTSTYITSSAYAYGIYANQSSNSDIHCNILNDQYRGILFNGSNCIGTNLRGNEMQDHYIGLYLYSSAVIDTQRHAGNHWTGSYVSTYGAVNYNAALPGDVFKNLFVVNSGGGSSLFPSTPIGTGSWPDNTGWFSLIASGTTFSCSDSCTNVARMGGGSEELRMLIAKDSTITSDFIPESKILAKQYLYHQLASDTSLLFSDPEFGDFKSENQFTSIGYLHKAKEALVKSTDTDSSISLDISVADSLKFFYGKQIFEIDNLFASDSTLNLSSTRDSLIQEINQQVLVIETLIEQQHDSMIVNTNIAEINNNLVVPTGIPDANEKFINSIILKYKRGGVVSIATNYSEILDLAFQCPTSGGKSVFIARIFVSLFNDSIYYDDENVCAALGYFRNHKPVQSINTIADFIISPNPANDYVDITLVNNTKGVQYLNFFNSKGSLVNSVLINNESSTSRFDISKLNPGVYSLKLNGSDNFKSPKKLIILR